MDMTQQIWFDRIIINSMSSTKDRYVTQSLNIINYLHSNIDHVAVPYAIGIYGNINISL